MEMDPVSNRVVKGRAVNEGSGHRQTDERDDEGKRERIRYEFPNEY